MQEYSSVAVSSYKAGDLSSLLNEQAQDGWSVVSIVAAGSEVVAYLSRETQPGTQQSSAASTDVGSLTPDDSAEAASTGLIAAGVPVAPDDTEAPAPIAAEAADAVDEPAGWAIAPDHSASAAVTDSTASAESTASAPSNLMPDISVADDTAAVIEPAAAVAQPAAASTAAAAESTVPAGWYADPSGRYELRYWDGSAWTEHVSRAGQQFTDPPVA